MEGVTTFDPIGAVLGIIFIAVWVTGLVFALRKQHKLDEKVKQQRKRPGNTKVPISHATLINGQQLGSSDKPRRLKKRKKAVDPWDIEAPHLCEDVKGHRSWEGRDPWD